MASGSSISADGKVLTCLIKDVPFGTAAQFVTNVIAEGSDGDQIAPTLTVNGDTKTLSPITIHTVKGVELQSDYGAYLQTLARIDGTAVFAIPFTVSVPKGGDLLGGPVSFDVKVTWRYIDSEDVPQ